MGDCHNHHVRWSEAIHDLVRESSNRHAAGMTIGGDRRSDLRSGFDEREGGDDRVEELTTEAGSASFVPTDGLGKFLGSGLAGAERPIHRPRISFSTRRLTSVQGSSFTVPASIAATRRSISIAHAAPASGSAGPSRLAKSSAATSARASRSRRNASARTASAGLVMSSILRSDSPRHLDLIAAVRHSPKNLRQRRRNERGWPVETSGQRNFKEPMEALRPCLPCIVVLVCDCDPEQPQSVPYADSYIRRLTVTIRVDFFGPREHSSTDDRRSSPRLTWSPCSRPYFSSMGNTENDCGWPTGVTLSPASRPNVARYRPGATTAPWLPPRPPPNPWPPRP